MKSMNDISAEHQLLDFLNPVSGLKSQVAFIFAVSLLMFLFLSPWIKQQHLAVFVLYKKLPLHAYKPKLSKSQHYEHSWKTLRASYLKGVSSSSSSSLIAAVGAKGLHAVSPTLSVLSNRFGYFPARPLRFVSLFLDCPSPSSLSVVFRSPSDLQDFIQML